MEGAAAPTTGSRAAPKNPAETHHGSGMKLSISEFFGSDTAAVTVEPRDPQPLFPMHEHSFEELVIVQSGNGWQVINDEPYFITCGEIFYLHANDHHEYASVDDLHLTNILYRPDKATFGVERMQDDESRINRHWQVTEDVLAELRPIIQALSRETAARDRLSLLMAETLFLQLNLILQRHRFAPFGAHIPAAARIGHVLSYIRQNCTEEVDFDDLARRFGFSGRNFTRAFREATGTTPHNFLVKTRINRAMRALGSGEGSITDIAYDCGFNDSNYFSFCFSKQVGLTPSDYRRRQQRRVAA